MKATIILLTFMVFLTVISFGQAIEPSYDSMQVTAGEKKQNADQIQKLKVNRPLFIVNGKEMNTEQAAQINPETIESVTVLKNKQATDLYFSKGENGVILIKLKKGIKPIGEW